ncbi:restriction endonuclease subunit S [Pseudomonas sp. p50]|uniref:restriction endonuclease subunit S n=1 Tax=Pseudomonas sp. p50(2008) TaxID=2816832 RepID=UPI00188D5938|nr:restriction endonuclease subunit S [Pseudomonas sp. p50(2008)]MBF4557147.1 restriction endonuclease subunit S [Pseudomonas sp. p50(2008)]
MKFVKLKALCEFEKGSTGLAKAEPGDYSLVTTGAERKTCNTYQFDTKAVCIPLVSSTGHGHASLKNVHYQEGKFALGSILVALTSKDENKLDIQFLHLYLSQLKDRVLVPLMSGAANVALSVKKIQDIEIPLPSIGRQREIVVKFKSIVIEDGELKSELTHQQALLKKLRQQILQEAIEGKLTVDWRAQNPDVEPASELLQRIGAEQAERVKERKSNAQKPLPPIDGEEKPFELPHGWAWCRLGDLISISSGDGLISSQMNGGDIPVFGGNGINGYHDTYNTNEATVTIGRVGAYCGAVHLTPEHSWITDNCFRVYFSRKNIDTNYILLHLKQMDLGKSSYKGAQPVISGKRVYPLLTQLPPYREQQAIVTKVEKFLNLCDQLETQISQNQTYAKSLMQTVLKEAFSHHSESEPSMATAMLTRVARMDRSAEAIRAKDVTNITE